MKNTYIKHETTIEELCKNIVAAASAQLQEHGVISPTFICVGPRRTVHWTAQSLSNKSVIAQFVNDCRLLCVAKEATNAMFVAQISIGSEKSPAIKTTGSSTKDAQECLLIQIEEAEGQNESLMVPILPQAGGKPTLGRSRIMFKSVPRNGHRRPIFPRQTCLGHLRPVRPVHPGHRSQKKSKTLLDARRRRRRITKNEPDAKAILPEPHSVKKANSYQ